MKVVSAQVIEGRIDVPPEIADGAQVAVVAPEECEPLALSPDEERELSGSLADIQAGNYVEGWALLGAIKAKNRV